MPFSSEEISEEFESATAASPSWRPWVDGLTTRARGGTNKDKRLEYLRLRADPDRVDAERAYRREYRQRNIEKKRAYGRNWAKNHPLTRVQKDQKKKKTNFAAPGMSPNQPLRSAGNATALAS